MAWHFQRCTSSQGTEGGEKKVKERKKRYEDTRVLRIYQSSDAVMLTTTLYDDLMVLAYSVSCISLYPLSPLSASASFPHRKSFPRLPTHYPPIRPSPVVPIQLPPTSNFHSCNSSASPLEPARRFPFSSFYLLDSCLRRFITRSHVYLTGERIYKSALK